MGGTLEIDRTNVVEKKRREKIELYSQNETSAVSFKLSDRVRYIFTPSCFYLCKIHQNIYRHSKAKHLCFDHTRHLFLLSSHHGCYSCCCWTKCTFPGTLDTAKNLTKWLEKKGNYVKKKAYITLSSELKTIPPSYSTLWTRVSFKCRSGWYRN